LRPSLGPPSGQSPATWRERLFSLPKLWPAFTVALIIIGGIYGGIFTVTEAAGVGTFVLLVLFLFVQGFSRQSWQAVSRVLRETISLTGMVLLILTTAQIFSRLLVLSGLGPLLAEFVINQNVSSMGFVLGATTLYLLLGTVIDSVSVLAITIPLFFPMVKTMGLDEIWFAMVMILATQIGNITPPIGLIIYAVKGVAEPDMTLEDIFRGTLPFFVMMLIALGIVILFPSITTWLPYHIL